MTIRHQSGARNVLGGELKAAGVAPPVVLGATHEEVLAIASLDVLKHASA